MPANVVGDAAPIKQGSHGGTREGRSAMFHFADPIIAAERQKALRDEAHQERLAALARSSRAPIAARDSDAIGRPLAVRLGLIVAGRLGRLVAAGR